MLKKIIIHTLIISFLLSGCYSWEVVQRPELNSELRITTKDKEQFELETWQKTEEYIIGLSDDSKEDNNNLPLKIKIADIDKVEVKYLDGLNTTLFICGSTILFTFAAYGMYYFFDKVKSGMRLKIKLPL